MLSTRMLIAVAIAVLAAATGTRPGVAGGGASIVYVDQAATGGNSGDNWANAFVELRDAMAAASDDAEIWVAQGTYRASEPFSRSVFFEPKASQKIYGGFAGGETERSQRDPDTYATVLSADPGTPASTDDAYHAVLYDGATTAGVLDGFRIRGGYADGPGIRDVLGGGIALFQSSPTLANLVIEQGFATNSGGGIFALNGTPHIEDVEIRENTSLDVGGGIGLSASDAVLDGVTIVNNQAVETGGGLYNQTGSPRIVGATIARNEARNGAGLGSVEGSPEVEDSVIEANFAYSGSMLTVTGGGVYLDGGAPAFRRVILRRNVASDGGEGGGAAVVDGTPSFEDTSFVGNRADEDAGALLVEAGSPSVVRSLLAGNVSGEGGGAIFNVGSLSLTNVTVSGNRAVTNGALSSPGPLTVAFSTFTGNASPATPAIYAIGATTFSRSIAWGNSNGEIEDGTVDGAVITNSLIEGGCPANSQCVPGDALSVNPDLIPLADNGGPTRTHALPASSPAIDAATACDSLGTDQRGFRRPADGNLNGITACDLGAYERVPGPTTVQFATLASGGKESLSPAQISVGLTERLDLPVTVGYRVIGGTATSGTDYVLAAGTLTLPSRSLARGITFAVTPDRFDEPIETIEVELHSPVNAALGGRATHTYNINDDDPPTKCRGRNATIIGTSGDDVLKGTTGPDVIVGRGGKDRIDGGGGDDVVCAGVGDDLVRGGAGNDLVLGAGGNDQLEGGDGADVLYGQGGRDRLAGGKGTLDGCDGGPGTDSLARGHGCESIAGVP